MNSAPQKYRLSSRLIHWVMAFFILGMVPVGFIMIQDGLSRPLQNFLFISHKNFGVLMLILIAVRLVNRFAAQPKLAPVPLPKIQELAATATHVGLYALMVIMPLSGYIRVRAGGFPIEALDALGIPALVPRSDALAEVAKSVHFYGAYALAAILAMHIGAALLHKFVLRDGIFARMWPPLGDRAKESPAQP